MNSSGAMRATPPMLCGALAACSTCASAASGALAPAGVQAERIHALWQLTLWVCMGVFAAILVVFGIASRRARLAGRSIRVSASAQPAPRLRDGPQAGAVALAALDATWGDPPVARDAGGCDVLGAAHDWRARSPSRA